MNLSDIYKTFHIIASEYTFFSSTHITFFRIDQLVYKKKSLNKFKKTETISSIFSNHNRMKLEKKNWKIHKQVEIKQYTLNNQGVKEETEKEIRKYHKTTKMKIQHTKTYGMQQKQYQEGSLQ